MSEIRVDSIRNQVGTGAPSFPNGLAVTGVVTATNFIGDGSQLTGISVGTTATYSNSSGIASALTSTANVNTSGIITALSFFGTWNGVGIGTTYGGTGITTYSAGDILYASSINTLSKLSIGSNGQVLTVSAGQPGWAPASGGGGSGSGLGLFNTGIGSATGYLVTTSLANVVAVPPTAGQRYVIHSIQVSNITSASPADISGDFTGTSYSGGIRFANTIPVQAGTAIELLKKPKILNPSDVIRLQASLVNNLHATVTYETSALSNYFGTGINLTTTVYNDLYTATENSMIESVLLTNTQGVSDAKATVIWTDASNNIIGYYVYELVVPADATVEILEAPKYLQSGYKVRVLSNIANRLSAIIAGRTI
jgi:hypothetical protein